MPAGGPAGSTNARRPAGTRAATGPLPAPESRVCVRISPSARSAANTRPLASSGEVNEPGGTSVDGTSTI